MNLHRWTIERMTTRTANSMIAAWQSISAMIFLMTLGIFHVADCWANPIDQLKPGEWYEVPNSHLRDVVPSYPTYIGDPANIVRAWNSAAYDTTRDRLIVTGGGHNDYGGNEVYVFDMNTLTWSRIWGPSPNIPKPNSRTSCVETESDGNPVSRHTYDGLEYLPNVDKFWMHGGSKYCSGGSSSKWTWTFDFATGQWQKVADAPYRSTLEMVSAYDPLTGEVLVAGKSSWQKLIAYDPVTDTWSVRGDLPIDWPQTATVETKRHWFISLGGGKVWKYDLNTSGTAQREELVTTGATDMVFVQYPGVAYDPVSDRIVAWHGGPYVYALDLDTLIWRKLLPTNSVTPAPAPKQGTYGRWQYVPSKNLFIGVTGVDDNVWIYRLSDNAETASSPPPDSTPPSVSIVSPSQGATISGSLTLQATASDSSGIAGLTFFIDGQAIANEDTQAPFEVNWNSATISDGTYTLQATARDAVGNIATDSITVTIANASVTKSAGPPPSPPTAPIDIPTGVFVALEWPDGPPIGVENSKHVTWAHNPIDGRLYSMGGDMSGNNDSYGNSYRQDMYSFSIAERWANKADKNAGWRQEFPYCSPGGNSVQPKSPDFVGWTWDPTRNVFWMVPGTMVLPVKQACPDRTVSKDDDEHYKYKHIMTYNPFEPDLTKRWTDWGKVPSLPGRGETWQSVYDPVTDTIIRFGHSKQVADIYDVKTQTWTTIGFGSNAVGGTVRIGRSSLSPDFENRVIYAVDIIAGRLMRWHMDQQILEDLGPVPDGPYSGALADGYSAWDSVNKVLLFFHQVTHTLHVYHPDTGTWETPPQPTDPPGLVPDVKHSIVFDPYQNVLALLGHRDDNHDYPYLYLYRYKNGNLKIDSVPPSPPTGLTID
ncbi:MAG: hypothetical protein D6690_01510 [Nitrospirae bacterium]|nr:MAG: hypothetical protein D6690_01510 [Nitrospirota bacterium]